MSPNTLETFEFSKALRRDKARHRVQLKAIRAATIVTVTSLFALLGYRVGGSIASALLAGSGLYLSSLLTNSSE